MRILVVDDDIFICKSLKRSGDKIGIAVDYAISIFSVNKSEYYDLILIDYMMKPCGRSVYKELKECFPTSDFAYYTSLPYIENAEIPVIEKYKFSSIEDILNARRIQCSFLRAWNIFAYFVQ